MPLLVLALIAAQAAMPMPARKPDPVCVRAGDLPPAFARWNAPPATMLAVGAPFLVVGSDPATVTWATGGPSARAGKAAVISFRVDTPGVYRVGLAAGAWVDVVQGGKALTSVAHGHGPACTGLRKIVDFRLAAGMYALQLGGMPGDTVKVMMVKK